MKQAPVHFNIGFSPLNQLLKEKEYSKVFILVDENTHQHCLPILMEETEALNVVDFIEIPAGEDTKQLYFVESVWNTLSDLGADRKSLLINLGGGVVTDFGGFVAATYKRGIDFVNIPTSLLAMVDASAGGKTGIDLNGVKNQIGTFSQPQFVIIHPQFIQTLAHRQVVSGFAEMLKHGLIQDKNHWKDLIQLNKLTPQALAPLIEDSVNIKINVVEQDPLEKGLRKILNAGHTLGHAIETFYLNQELLIKEQEEEWHDEEALDDLVEEILNLNIEEELESLDVNMSKEQEQEGQEEPSITHGEAVALGLILETHIAWQKGLLQKTEFNEIFYHLTEIYPPKKIPKIEDLLEVMKHDKKNEDGKIKFVMLHSIGHCEPHGVECSNTEIENAIKYYEEHQ